jgi:hypothetical protein
MVLIASRTIVFDGVNITSLVVTWSAVRGIESSGVREGSENL